MKTDLMSAVTRNALTILLASLGLTIGAISYTTKSRAPEAQGTAAAAATEQLDPAQRHADELAVREGLKEIRFAQTLYREGDKDGDGTEDYAADLQTLGRFELVNAELARGVRYGYRFEVCRAPGGMGQFMWMAIASPLEPGSGQRSFATNHTGQTWVRGDAPFVLIPQTCEPQGGKTLDR